MRTHRSAALLALTMRHTCGSLHSHASSCRCRRLHQTSQPGAWS
ncbi:hypothetical protein AB0M44_10535 [Streptosporangium subroseum]